MTLYLAFWNQVDTDDGGASNSYYYDCFANETYEGNPNNGNEVIFAECEYIGDNLRDAQWKGWMSFNQAGNGGDCADCHMAQTASIAQPVNQPGNNAYFGPINFTEMEPLAWPAGSGYLSYSYCYNFPAWQSGGGSECGNTPISAQYTVIDVTSQVLTPPGGESLTINNDQSGW